jgi:hypothetical protein
LTEDIPGDFGFEKMRWFRGFCPVGWVETEPDFGGFDYLTFPMPHGPNSPMPDRLGGTSGAGLWQIILDEGSEGKRQIRECLLSGVAFFQGAIANDTSRVRCHGRARI